MISYWLTSHLRRRQERAAFGEFVNKLSIKIPHQEQLARNLSEGKGFVTDCMRPFHLSQLERAGTDTADCQR